MIEVGDKAPAFTLQADGGRRVSLSDFRGHPVVVYFYPRDNTPGCTREAIAFSEAKKRFDALGAKVVGVSKDSVASHDKFKDQHALSLSLLSDPDLTVHRAYGAFGTKTMYGKKVEGVIRSTFVVDAGGKIAKVFPSVKVDGHVDKVLVALGGGETAKSVAKKPAAKKAAAKSPAKKAVKSAKR